jgi:glycosyltransferase involved in cell wall biosynthesis
LRFLIDVTTARLRPYGKYSRVLRLLADEAGHDAGSLVTVSGADIRRSPPLEKERREPPIWAGAALRPPAGFSEAQGIAKLLAHYCRGRLSARGPYNESKLDLVFAFARTFDCFPLPLRAGLASFLELEADAECREMFTHWVGERARAPAQIRQADACAPLEALGPGDALILAGASWNHIDADAFAQLKREKGFTVLVVLYDLLPIAYPSVLGVREFLQYKRFLLGAARIADVLVAANQTCAHDLRLFLRDAGAEPAGRIACMSFRAAILRNDGAWELSPRLQSLGLDRRPFALSVAALRRRKHPLWLYALFLELRAREGDVPLLVFAGRADELRLLRILSQDPLWGKAAVLVENPSDAELAWLYRNAQLCLFPSFEGGAGFSALEALAFGAPCIVADAPALIESCDGLATHLPRDEALWLEALRCHMSENGRRRDGRQLSMDRPGLLAQMSALLGQSG